MSKYGAKKTEVDGIVFDSKREAKRYMVLRDMETAGEISELELQKKFVLIPAQYADVDGKRKCVERACEYRADFCYKKAGEELLTVEDTKGFKTKDYIIKRKLMLHEYGLRIKEV